MVKFEANLKIRHVTSWLEANWLEEKLKDIGKAWWIISLIFYRIAIWKFTINQFDLSKSLDISFFCILLLLILPGCSFSQMYHIKILPLNYEKISKLEYLQKWTYRVSILWFSCLAVTLSHYTHINLLGCPKSFFYLIRKQ